MIQLSIEPLNIIVQYLKQYHPLGTKPHQALNNDSQAMGSIMQPLDKDSRTMDSSIQNEHLFDHIL